MAYGTQSDLLKMISQEELAALTADAGEVPDGAVVEEAIRQAEAEIDSYLGTCYTVPFSPVPAQIKALCLDLAIYRLYSRRSVVPAVRRQRYDAAVSFLKEAAGGGAVVEGVDGPAPGGSREVVEVSSASRVFSRDTQGDW